MTSESKLEQVYQVKKQKEHILDAPDTYIGSIEGDTIKDWTFHGEESIKRTSYSFIPGLYKCFDEGVVNCRDHFIRQQDKINNGEDNVLPVTLIDVDINRETGIITLVNDGNGIDIAKHPKNKLHIPEMIFAHLMTSTNYDKNKKKITGGKNGFGVKLVFIYSSWGRIETVDHIRKKKYTQEFKNNLSVIDSPIITKCTKKPYTKIQFKLDFQRFGVDGITDDIYNILKKRTYDIAAVTDKSVKVGFNNSMIPVRAFEDYLNLYIGPKGGTKRFFEKQGCWEYAICNTPIGEFTHVSFVNGVCTSKGGKHVEYLMNQIIRKITNYIEKKKKIKVTSSSVKEQLMLFLNVSIVNPSFDSQTKNNLTTPSSKFGSKCEVSDTFVENIIKKLGVMDAAINLTQVKENKKSSIETDGSRTKSVSGIPKLSDANYAGTSKSKLCTLILCEGDSAKAGVVSGLDKDDRNYYGVFPLRGKMRNVSEISAAKVNQNAEVANIKRAMGLKSDQKFNSIEDVHKNLRYGKIIFMTDQDLDGSHIKGLCINLFHAQWPELIELDSFLGFMNTPIIKVRKGTKEISFYTEQEYNTWKQNNNDGKGWTAKYFKGLGTSTAKEFKEYFKEKKLIEFSYSGDECKDAIDLAFNKKRADDRKDWLREYDRDAIMDIKTGNTSYKQFVDLELSHFSKYDCDRSIPNLVDGNKISTRKILYAAFKRNLTKEVKVAQFSGYVSEHTCYHHGENSLNGAIIGMAAEYVGNSNISVLMPKGQFGTRLRGGDDHASERYIFTNLNPITRNIFPESDTEILNYLDDDGTKVEPEYFVPIIPMIAVNGGKGIGTGFSCDIPSFNTMQIIEYLEHKINKAQITPPTIDVYYEDFKGDIIKVEEKKYLIKGKYNIIDTTTVIITELPIGMWTETYKEYLESLLDNRENRNKKKTPYIKSYKDLSTDTEIHFEITFLSGVISKLLPVKVDYNCNKLEKLLKMYTTKTLTNMWLFDSEQKLNKYDSVYSIIDAYFPVRFEMYIKRREHLIKILERIVLLLQNKVRFIQEQCDDTIDLRRKKKEIVIKLLEDRNYDVIDDDREFKYLRSMKIEDVEEENMNKLIEERNNKIVELEIIKQTTPETIWLEELDNLKEQYKTYRLGRANRKSGGQKKKVKKIKKIKKSNSTT